jgi:hypothetical protein
MTDVTDKDRDTFIEAVAQRVVKMRMEAPAIFFLEMHKPLAFVAGQSLLVASPVLAPFFGIDKVGQASEIMSDRANVERLIRRIEELSEEVRGSRGK